VERSAEALVLTELAEAQQQTKLYVAGSVAGIELTDCRYLVMVSQPGLRMPPDQIEEG